MAAEYTQYNDNDKKRIIAIARKFMPLTFGEGYFGNGTANLIHYKQPSTPLILKSSNGNEFIVQELVTKIFFEQLIHFNEFEFDRDIEKKPVKRLQPLVANLDFDGERAGCYAWIKFQKERGKVGTNEIDWHVKRIFEVFKIDIMA